MWWGTSPIPLVGFTAWAKVATPLTCTVEGLKTVPPIPKARGWQKKNANDMAFP